MSGERTTLNTGGTVTVVPEVRRKPSNAQINRETTMLGRMFSLARQDDKIINRPHIRKLKEPAQPRKGFFEYGDFVKVRDHLDPALRNIAEFEYVTGWRIDTEVLPLLWRQVDFAAGELRIDAPRSTKNEEAPGISIYSGSSPHPRGSAEADRRARLAIRVLPFG